MFNRASHKQGAQKRSLFNTPSFKTTRPITTSLASAFVILSLAACGSETIDGIEAGLENGEEVNINLSTNEDGGLVISLADDEDQADTSETVIESTVLASEGGIFTSSDGAITIEIPADALSEDSELVVTTNPGLTTPTDNMTQAGGAFDISFGAALSAPASVSLAIQQAPVHPELAETTAIVEDEWIRSTANFFRASDNTVFTLIDSDVTLQPVLRTLQVESGDAVDRGLDVFLNSTFGNENFFGGVLGLQELLNNLAPSAAVSVGAQIDVAKVPDEIVGVLTGDDFAAIQAALESSAVTRALLRADAVVGVKAFFDDEDSDFATSAGITCALCHATVTPTEFELSEGEFVSLPIRPLNTDGTPNGSMDVGTILSLTPFATAAGQPTIDFLQGFGAGRFDARALPDNPLEDGLLNPTSIPPLWNFVDLNNQGYSYNWDGQFADSDGSLSALASRGELVFDLVMHANGAFGTDSSSVPLTLFQEPSDELISALVEAEDLAPDNDIDEQSQLDIQAWQRSLVSPAPGEFDEELAEAGFKLFYGDAQCSDLSLIHI